MADEKKSNQEKPQEDDLENSSGDHEANDDLEETSDESQNDNIEDQSEPTQGFTSKHIHPLFKTQAGTAEDSLEIPDSDNPDENAAKPVEPEKGRKVAKTMLESDLPDLDELKDKIAQASNEKKSDTEKVDEDSEAGAVSPGDQKRKVAKTMLESDLPDLDKLKDKIAQESIEQAKEETEDKSNSVTDGGKKRKVAKTMLESDSPDLDQLRAKIEESASDTTHGEVDETALENSAPEIEELKDKIEQAEKNSPDNESKERLTVARTMLEADFPDLLRIQALIETKESINEQRDDDTDKRTAILEKPQVDQSEVDKSAPANQDPRASYSKLQQALLKGAPDEVRISPRLTNELKVRSLSRSFASISESSTKSEILIDQADKITEPEPLDAGASEQPLKASLDFRPIEHEIKETSTLELVDSNQDNDDTVLISEQPDRELVKSEAPIEDKEDHATSEQEESLPQAENQEESVSKSKKYENAAKREEYVARTMLDHELILDQLGDSISRIEQKEMEEVREKEREEEEKEALDPIAPFKTVKTCPWAWEDTGVQDKFRFCGECDNLIYDFTGMGKSEAEAIIFQRENRRKYTLYKREDGKFMTANCPQGAKKARLIAFVSLVVIGILSFLVAATWFVMSRPKPAKTVQQTEQPQTKTSVVDETKSTGSTNNTTQTSPSAVPKMNPDGSLYYDADKATKTQSNQVQVSPQSNTKEEPDYRNVPEADESGKQWKFN